MTTAMTDSANIDQHAADHAVAPSYDDVNTPVIVMVGLVSAIVTVLIIWTVQGMCYHWQKRYLQQTGEVVNLDGVEQINQQVELINGGKGITPISKTMDQIVSDFGSKEPTEN